MKQKDIVLILVTVFISAVVAIFLSKIFIAPPKNRQQKVEKITAIDSNFPDPDKNNFNTNSVDPTRSITIGTSTNPQPFNNKQ